MYTRVVPLAPVIKATNWTRTSVAGIKVFAVTTTRRVHVEMDAQLQKTSHWQNACQIAVNGGPFQADGTPVGLVVAQGHILRQVGSPTDVGFGSNGTHYHIGSITDAVHLQDYVTGFDWLVRDARNVVVEDKTGAHRAARTAMGVTTDGQLVLAVTNGCERWYDLPD